MELRKECPICTSAESTSVVVKKLQFANGLDLSVYECADCRHPWIPTTDDEQQIIEKRYGQTYVGFRKDEVFNEIVRNEIQNRLSLIAPPPCSLLDVGCGGGEFLSLASKFSYDCLGGRCFNRQSRNCQRKRVECRSIRFSKS